MYRIWTVVRGGPDRRGHAWPARVRALRIGVLPIAQRSSPV